MALPIVATLPYFVWINNRDILSAELISQKALMRSMIHVGDE